MRKAWERRVSRDPSLRGGAGDTLALGATIPLQLRFPAGPPDAPPSRLKSLFLPPGRPIPSSLSARPYHCTPDTRLPLLLLRAAAGCLSSPGKCEHPEDTDSGVLTLSSSSPCLPPLHSVCWYQPYSRAGGRLGNKARREQKTRVAPGRTLGRVGSVPAREKGPWGPSQGSHRCHVPQGETPSLMRTHWSHSPRPRAGPSSHSQVTLKTFLSGVGGPLPPFLTLTLPQSCHPF